MKNTIVASAACALLCTLSTRSAASTIVFADDFSTSSVLQQGNPYVGGWFTPQLAFQQWTGTTEASVAGGGLNVETTNGTRSAGIVLAPSLFDGAGEYVLSFDLSAYTGGANNEALATVWSGSGYDLNGTTGNGITVDTYSASLTASGLAEVAQLAELSLDSASNGNQLGFTYDGSSAVAVFFGARTNGWPFPSATYDNVSIAKAAHAPVPEPGTPLLIGLAVVALISIRRRVS